MVSLALVALVCGTSLAAYVLGTRLFQLRTSELRHAGVEALESAGLTVLFVLANLVLGVGVILAVRVLSGQFVSVYLVNDLALVVLSALQALVFQAWRRRVNFQHHGTPPVRNHGIPRPGPVT